jgi:hypothetical protein
MKSSYVNAAILAAVQQPVISTHHYYLCGTYFRDELW